jgi:hypothetical protein
MIRDSASQSPFLPAWIWLIPLACLAFLVEALQSRPSNPTEGIVWFSVISIIGAAALTRACRVQKQFDLFEPLHLVLALFLIFYPVRALFAVWLDESWFDPAKAAIWKGLSAAVLGFVSFAVGYKIAQRKFDGQRRIWLDRSWNLERANAVSLWFLLIGIAGFVAMRFLGGSLFYFISLDPDIKSPESMKAWFYYLFWVCLLVQIGALLQLGSWLATGRRALWTVAYSALAILSGFLLARNFVVLFMMMVMVCWHYKRSRIKVAQAGAIIFLLVVYLGVAGLYREWISPTFNLDEVGSLGELASQQKELALHYVVGNLEELSNLSELVRITPSELPYQVGATFTPAFLKPIPRVLMPSKPLGASAAFTRQLFGEAYDNGYVTALGAWGEWYLNFSWVGLVLGMALMGAVTAAAYKAMQATNEFGRVVLYATSLVVLLSWLRSDFHSASTYGLYYLIPLVFALALITDAKPGAPQAARL